MHSDVTNCGYPVAAWTNFLTFSSPDFTFSTEIITYNSGRISRLQQLFQAKVSALRRSETCPL